MARAEVGLRVKLAWLPVALLGESDASDAAWDFLDEDDGDAATLGLAFVGVAAAFLGEGAATGEAVAFLEEDGVLTGVVLGDCFLVGEGVLTFGVAALAWARVTRLGVVAGEAAGEAEADAFFGVDLGVEPAIVVGIVWRTSNKQHHSEPRRKGVLEISQKIGNLLEPDIITRQQCAV